MTQDEINQAEWKNPDNWSFGLYSSSRDTRTWVPKRMPWRGWTINMGSPAGPTWMICFVAGVAIILVAAYLAIAHR